MVVFRKELKQGRIMWLVTTGLVCFFLGFCVLIYPQMKEQMTEVSNVFSEMGQFSIAFGLDQLNFGEFKGYFGVECGNVLGMFGAFFASFLGISALAKEEKDQTAEFLLTHPISRSQIVFEKLLAIFAQITVTNLCLAGFSYVMFIVIGEEFTVKEYAILFWAYYLMQLEIAALTFAISAFLRRSGMGLGLGIATVFYLMGIFSKLIEELEPIKYMTPFGYADSAYILTEGKIEASFLLSGMVILLFSVVIAFRYYRRKEIY